MAVVESFEHFPHKFDHDDPHSSAEILISRFRPDLVEKLKDDHLCVEVVSGGYTNKLLVLYFESDPSEKILLRIYGEDTENFIDRDREINLLRTLYKHKCSGEVYGIFGNGMCYEYVPGETLTADMAKDPHVTTLIIQKLVQLHCIDREQGNLPEISLFDKMDSMLRWVPKQYANSVTQENFDQLNLPTVDQLGAEVELLRTHLDRAENFSPLVFCHNDLFYGNIIYEEDSDRLHFIDFEYAGINHQAYDIGNFFNELAGVKDCDYSRYPDRKFQIPWLRHYLEGWNAAHGEPVVTDYEVERLYVLVNKFSLVAHLFWIIWSFQQAETSRIDFDYLQYAKIRLDEYRNQKEARLSAKVTPINDLENVERPQKCILS